MEQNRKGAMMKPFNLLTLMGLLAAAPLCATSLVIGSTETTSTAQPFLQVWGTLATEDTTDSSGTTSAYCVDALVVNATGALSLAEVYTVPSTGSIGGAGSVTGDVTFSDGASLDATSGTPLSVTGTVTHSGKTQIALSTAPTDTTQLMAITSDSTPDAPTDYTVTAADNSDVSSAKVTAGTSGLYVSVPVSETSSMVVETTDSEGTTTSTAIEDTTAKEALAALVQENASTASSVKVTGTTKTGATETTTLDATQLEGALACFEDVTTIATSTDNETGATVAEVTVAYNFGISQLKEATVDNTRYLVVGVEVQKSDGTAATYASGTSIALTSDGTTIEATEVTTIEGTTAGESTTSGMKFFRIPLTTFTSITSPIEVKATNTGTSTASIAE